MARGKSIARYLNPWMFKREKMRSRVAALLAAYGDNCWHCGHRLSFHPLATRRRASIEHLKARKNGGTSEWSNIRLCHSSCNRHLGTNSPEQKRRMRLPLALQIVPDYRDKTDLVPLGGTGVWSDPHARIAAHHVRRMIV